MAMGAVVDAVDDRNTTALIRSTEEGHLQIVEVKLYVQDLIMLVRKIFSHLCAHFMILLLLVRFESV